MAIDNRPDYETVEYHVIYSALINAARHQGLVTYQELAQMVGLPPTGSQMGKRIGEILGAISVNEVNQGRPMLSALCVTTEGVLGGGVFPEAQRLGLLKSDQPSEQQMFWEDQKRRLYLVWKPKYHM